jgi:hypothetical protein
MPVFQVFSPAKVIFVGISVLILVCVFRDDLSEAILTQILQAAKDVNASQGMLIELFDRIGYFFRRLEIYTKVPPTPAMTDVIVEIMVKVIMILGIATKEMKRGRLSELASCLFIHNS